MNWVVFENIIVDEYIAFELKKIEDRSPYGFINSNLNSIFINHGFSKPFRMEIMQILKQTSLYFNVI